MSPSSHSPQPAAPSRQKGSATLFVSVMLVVLVTLSGLYALRSVLFEQKDSGNHYWATQAHEAAQSGIEHAVAWLANAYAGGVPATFNGPVWDAANAAHCPAGYTDAQWQCLSLDTTTGLASSDVIAQHSLDVRLLRDITRPNLALILAAARHTTNQSAAQVQQVVYIPFGQGGSAPAPLIINGCISGTTGTPDICPDQGSGSPCPLVSTPGTPGTAILNLLLRDVNNDGVINDADRAACLSTGHLNLHGGVIVYPEFPPTPAPCNTNASWTTLFGDIPKTLIQEMSNIQASAGLSQSTTPKRTVYWIDSTAPFHDDLGSAEEPVIVVFSSAACTPNCPAINGNPSIYGTVYLDTGCDATRANGWGGGKVYGTVAFESGMSNLNANTLLQFNPRATGAQPPPLPPGADATRVQRLAGSWKDWN